MENHTPDVLHSLLLSCFTGVVPNSVPAVSKPGTDSDIGRRILESNTNTNDNLLRELARLAEENKFQRELLDAHYDHPPRTSDSTVLLSNMIDTYSLNECIALTNSLNAKVHQIAGAVIHACFGSMSATEGDSNLPEVELEEIQSLRPMIGDVVFDFLLDPRSRRRRDYMFVAWSTVQACLVTLCVDIITAWSFNEEESNALSDLYSCVRQESGNQLLTGTWRALTRSQSKIRHYHTLKADATESLAFDVAKVLVLCGAPWTLSDAHGIVEDFFHSSLSEMYACCFRLDRVLGEGMRSCDVKVWRAEPGEEFNEKKMYAYVPGWDADGKAPAMPSTRDEDEGQVNSVQTERERGGTGLDGASTGPCQGPISMTCYMGLVKSEITDSGVHVSETILLQAGVQLMNRSANMAQPRNSEVE